jgi:hypothetical protein
MFQPRINLTRARAASQSKRPLVLGDILSLVLSDVIRARSFQYTTVYSLAHI